MRARDLDADPRSVREWVRPPPETMLVAPLDLQVRRASAGARARSKVFAADHGLVSAFAAHPRQPGVRGRVFEAAVFRHLRELARSRRQELSYFRQSDELEIDFVLADEDGILCAVEVTSAMRLRGEKVERLRRAGAALGTDRLVLVHGGFVEEEAEGVRPVPPGALPRRSCEGAGGRRVSRRVPLGRKEDFHLEFKGRDALGDPEKIAREVVAFLNADGGEVWVGLGEEDGRAVKVEPISDAEQAQRRLLDFLIETVEPSPSAKEVRVEVVDEGEGAVLRVGVQPDGGRGPYAFLRKGGRHFVLRIGERIRPMSREEVFKTQPSGDERLRQALGRRAQRALRTPGREEGRSLARWSR